MTQVNDFNQQIIEEFRENDGKVGGPFKGARLLLLHTTGAKSGEERVNPLAYRRDGDNLVVFGSKAGAPTNPDWYHNLRANPRAKVEVDGEECDVNARVAEGEEHDRLWQAQKDDIPNFAEYEQKTDRRIPVIVLERTS
jgi:deazaflavin-dependent oxidoreductase (nitroreductase family)